MVVKVDIQKTRQGLYWTNRWLLDAASPADVTVTMVENIAVREMNFHANTCIAVSARVSDMVPDTDNFYIYPLNFIGEQTDSTEPLPGYVTMRADFGVGPGRPLRKYWRVYIGEGHTTGGVWTSTYVDAVNTQMDLLLAAVPTICDPQGNVAITVAAKSQLQMRQLRRGTRKRTEPVIPLA